MKKIVLGLILLTLTAAAQAKCVAWETTWDRDRWGNPVPVYQCVRYAPPPHVIHHHHHHHNHRDSRTSDVLLGVVIGAGAYHVIERDRRRDHRRDHRRHRHCWQDHRGRWVCRN